MPTATAPTGTLLGYARVSTGHQSLDQQLDALQAAGVAPERIYQDKLSGTSTREQRPGLAALLDYARPGDAIVTVGIDRLGRSAAEVMTTIRDLGQRDIVLKSLREGAVFSTDRSGAMSASGSGRPLDSGVSLSAALGALRDELMHAVWAGQLPYQLNGEARTLRFKPTPIDVTLH